MDEQATSYNIKTAITQLAKTAEPSDLVVLYISSHGSPENLDTAGNSYFVTFDTEWGNLYATAYKMNDLMDDVDVRIKAERVVALLDTCYSGRTFQELPPGWAATSRALTTEFGSLSPALQKRLNSGGRALAVVDSPAIARSDRMPQGVGRVVITSSSDAEKSWEGERIKHGYFTYYLLEALQRTPVSLEDIYAHLKANVPAAVRRDLNESQHPTIARMRHRGDLYLRDEIRPAGKR
jgi:uncharacterized caspase-like protein